VTKSPRPDCGGRERSAHGRVDTGRVEGHFPTRVVHDLSQTAERRSRGDEAHAFGRFELPDSRQPIGREQDVGAPQ